VVVWQELSEIGEERPGGILLRFQKARSWGQRSRGSSHQQGPGGFEKEKSDEQFKAEG